MSLSGKIKNAGKWQALSVVSMNLIQLVYFAIMTRLLFKEDYGLMAVVNGIIGIGNIFIQGGMGSALIQRKNITHKHINGALQTSLLIGFSLYALFYFFSPYVASIYNDVRLDALIKVASLNLILLSLNNISLNLLFKNYSFKNASLVNIVSNILGYSLGVYLALQDFGVWSLVIATLVGSFFSTIALFYFAPIKISLKIHFKEASELFGFGSGMILLSLSNFLSNRGLNLVFGKIFTQDVLGIYERTSSLRTLPSRFISNIINKVMFPVMSEIQDEDKRLIEVYKFGLGLVNSIMLPTTVFLVFFSPEIVQILMGPKWTDVVVPLQIMFLVLIFNNSGSMTDSVIRAKGLVYKNVSRKYIFTVIIIILSGVLGYFFGINGAAVGIVISNFINYLMMIFLVKKIFKGSIREYFYQPLMAGIQLGFYLAILILAYKSIFGLWGETNILLFIVFVLGLLAIAMALLKFKPSFFGIYLERAIKNGLKRS
ncbi:lipopolysaccharide biosynthesis protein [Flagellimonas meridianipacifica]|uniref:O-antigen/teichoic acid export membrane protein n=1 Tax=Flagellimonas meridianipacifica TaxID=1080225 RepID=A0A2T0MCS3_9FLAO|nr:lipopolysaccharide biosynthesis protein [Allomuricauda pacifica]PRX55295.1 O-antigen/teichoic acid export membrane protein [Allomuricauda pacifica]